MLHGVIEVSTSIEIDRLADEVFAFVSEFRNNPRWQRGQRSCEWTSEPPLRVGSTYDQRAHFLGKDVVNSFEVIEHQPGRLVTFTSAGAAAGSRSWWRGIPRASTGSRSPSCGSW
jgi:uncharacterized membrane protein